MDALQILEKVNAFYSTAFGQLLTLTLAVLAFSGIILPIVVQLIQVRIFRTEQKTLQSQIVTGISAAKTELSAEFANKFQAEKEELQRVLKQEVDTVNRKLVDQRVAAIGLTFFLQGKVNAQQNDNANVARDFACAAAHLFKGKDEINAYRALNSLVANFLPKLDSRSYETTDDLDQSLDTLLTVLEEYNTNGRFTDTIQAIKSARSKGKSLKPVAVTTGLPPIQP